MLQQIDRTPDLSDQRRRDLRSAVRTAARALKLPPDRVPTAPRLLAARLGEVAPLAMGLSPRSWKNTRSLLRAALDLVRPMAPGRHLTPLSPDWQVLWDQLASRSLKTRLSRFLHYCSAAGFAPEAVDQDVFAAFRTHLDDTLLKDPETVYCDTVSAWNKAPAEVAAWPALRIIRPDRRNIWTLPWSAFAESFRADARVWLDRLANPDPLDDDAAFRPVRPSTLKTREDQIRRFASAVVLHGRDPASLTSLTDLVEVDTVKAGLRFFLDRRDGKPTSQMTGFVDLLTAIARHHVGVDEAHLKRLKAIRHRLSAEPRGLTQTNRTRLRPLDDRTTKLRLLRLPQQLMALAEAKPQPYPAALLAQTAVAIEILLMAPMRIGNLARLDLERHLIRPGANGGLHIVIESEEVKNRESLEFPLPAQCIALIERYITAFRPTLAASGGTALFPGQDGIGPKTIGTLRKQIKDRVHEHIGITVNPHLFRHAVAKLFLEESPGAYEVVRRVLGHRSIKTTTEHYTGTETAAAMRYVDHVLLKLRQGDNR